MEHTRCSIIIPSYNAAPDLPECLDSLIIQDYPDFEIIVVDNASPDSTAEIVASYNGAVRYLRLEVNQAISGGYNAGLQIATGEILIFLNADTVAHPGWLAALVEPLLQHADVGLTTSCILLYDTPELVNTCGNDVTWTGLTVCRGLGESVDAWQEESEIGAVSGAAFAIKRSLFEALGGFDETYRFYFEDTDLSMRATLAGYRIWYAPFSKIKHKYIFKFNPTKSYYQERNRWLTMFKIFRLPTLLIILPGLMVGELMAWAYSAIHGVEHLKAKWSSWVWLWANKKTIWRLRQQTQAMRKVSDRELLRLWSSQLRFEKAVPPPFVQPLERLTQPILWSYGRLCQLLLIW